jgi:predicted secreted protein
MSKLNIWIKLALFLTAPFAFAAEDAVPEAVGFSADGTRFSFVEYGVQDGSGFPFANGYVIDLVKDRYLAKPIREVIKIEGASALGVRERVRDELHGFDITEAARLVYARPYTGDFHNPDVVDLKWKNIEYGELSAQSFQLQMDHISMGTSDCPNGQGFMLTWNGRHAYEDHALPKSRGCAEGYTIERVYIPEMFFKKPYAVVLIGVHAHGFEGLSLRHIAVPLPLVGNVGDH